VPGADSLDSSVAFVWPLAMLPNSVRFPLHLLRQATSWQTSGRTNLEASASRNLAL
jgi:hypothetical protein